MVALSEEVFWAKAASWMPSTSRSFTESRLSPLSTRLKGDFVLDLLLLGVVNTIWRNCAASSSRRLEAATLAEAGLDVVDLGLGGGGAGVITPQSFPYQAIGMRHILAPTSQVVLR